MSDREEISPLLRLLRPPEGESPPAPHLGEAQRLPLRRLERGLLPEPVALAPGSPSRRWASSLVAALLALSLGGSLVALTLVGVQSIPVPPPLTAPEPLPPEVQAPPVQVAAPGEGERSEGRREKGGGEGSPTQLAAQPAVLGGRDQGDAAGGGGDGAGDGQGAGRGDQPGNGGGGGGEGGSGAGGGPADSVEESAEGDGAVGPATEEAVTDAGEVSDKVTGKDKAKKAKQAKGKGAEKGTGGKALGHIKEKGEGHLKDTPGLGHDKHHDADVVEGLSGIPGLG
jgi:hypothetical protein